MFTYRTDSPYPTLPRVRVVVEPLPADDHTSPSQVTATTLPLKEWAEDWYPIPSPLPAVSGERPDRTPKPLPVTTRTQLLGQIQQQAEAWCAVAQALDKHFPKWNPWCGRSGTENAVLCIEQAAADLARLQSELAGVRGEAEAESQRAWRAERVCEAVAALNKVKAMRGRPRTIKGPEKNARMTVAWLDLNQSYDEWAKSLPESALSPIPSAAKEKPNE